MHSLNGAHRATAAVGGVTDEVQDYTTYTEDDAGNYVTVTSDTVTATWLRGESGCRVYDDKGANALGLSLVATMRTSSAGTPYFNTGHVVFAIANTVEYLSEWWANDSQVVLIDWVNSVSTADPKLRISEPETDSYDTSSLLLTATDYWITVERTSETAVSCKIYSDSNRSTLVDTIVLTITSGRRYRYVYAWNWRSTSYGGDNGTFVSADLVLTY